MGLELSIKINNQTAYDYNTSVPPVKITDEHPVFNWNFSVTQRASVNIETGETTTQEDYGQYSYEIRISDKESNISTDAFIGNMCRTGTVLSQNTFWQYRGSPLVRGIIYYGQIKVVDESGRESDWSTFVFIYNSLPTIEDLVISPLSPSVTDNLLLSYTFYDADGDEESGTIIKWYKNGIYQKQHDNNTSVNNRFLQIKDRWMVEVYPSDGYEYGLKCSTREVLITKTAIVVSDVVILPSSPTVNDIIKVNYAINDYLEDDSLYIRWYINGSLVSSLNDEQYIKPDVTSGDTIRCEIRHRENVSYVSSASVTVVDSNFVISDILIDGREEPLDVSTARPSVRWKTYIPAGKIVNYVSIRIGLFYEDDSIYSEILDYTKEIFSIPGNLLENGRDYYVSIGASDTTTFANYYSSHFRMGGSRWGEAVSNGTGWTVESLLFTYEESSGQNDYHILRIADGDKFAEIKFKKDKITLISGGVIEYSEENLFYNKARILTVAGRGSDIKIYIDRRMVINGTSRLTQKTNVKLLEFGRSLTGEFGFKYKYFFYTVGGCYLPDSSSEYVNFKFHTFIEFSNNEVVALNGYVGGKQVFALNPDTEGENGAVYAIQAGEAKKSNTIARTFTPINKINSSPDNKKTVCAHASGATIICGYKIYPFDNDLTFINSDGTINRVYPESNGWEVVHSTSYTAAYFNSNGLNINTL